MSNLLEIQVEGGSLDLMSDAAENFFITKRIHDLRDLETRDTDQTQQLTIPRTINNIRLIGGELPRFREVSKREAAFYPCNVLLGGVTVMTNAQLIILGESVRNNTILIEIYGGTVAFFKLLSDDPLGSLSFEEYNFNWDLATLAGKMNTTSGILYPYISWLDNDSINRFNLEYVPANNTIPIAAPEVDISGAWIYIKDIFLKILSTMPIQFDTGFFDDFLNRLVLQLPITQTFDNWNKKDADAQRGQVTQTIDYAFKEEPRDQRLPFNNILSENPSGFWSAANNEFVVTKDAQFNVKFFYELYTYATSAFQPGYLRIYQNSTERARSGQLTGTGVRSGVINASFNAVVGDKIYIIFSPPLVGTPANVAVFYAYMNNSFEVAAVESDAGKYINVSDWLPQISQKDFVVNILKFYHLIPVEKRVEITDGGGRTVPTEKIAFVRFDDIINQPEQDLTQFMDISKDINLQAYISDYGRKNTMTYAKSEKVLREDISAEFQMESGSVFGTKTKVEVPFLPMDETIINDSIERVTSPLFAFDYIREKSNKITVNSGTTGFVTTEAHGLKPGDHIFVKGAVNTMKRKVVSITDSKNGNVDVNWIETRNQQDWDNIKYRVDKIEMQIGYVSDTGTAITIFDGGISQSVPASKKVTFPNELQWDALIKNHYRIFTDSVYKPYIIQAFFLLPFSTFSQLRMTAPVYIGGLESNQFYINSVEQYKLDGTVRMELLRIVKRGTINPTGTFSVAPTGNVNLGTWVPGDPIKTQVYTITNGSIPITININIDGPGSIYYRCVEGSVFNLASGQVLPITIEFDGTKAETFGPQDCSVLFSSSNANQVNRNITTQINRRAWKVEPLGTITLGSWNPGDPPLQQNINIINTGNITLSATPSIVGAGFRISPTTAIAIATGETKQATVYFDGDSVAGDKNATATISETTLPAETRPINANVATIRAIRVDPVGPVNLGTFEEGGAVLFQDFTIYNDGNVPIQLTIGGAGTGQTLSRTSILSNPGSPELFRLTADGTGMDPANYSSSLSIIGTGITTIRISTNWTVAVYNEISVTPEAVEAFGNIIQTGSNKSKTYTVTNNGNAEVTLAFSKTNAHYNINKTSATLAKGASTTITVTTNFTTSTPAGAQNNELVTKIGSTVYASNAQTATCVAAVKSFSVTPTETIDKGQWTNGQPQFSQTYELLNTGNLDILVSISDGTTLWTLSATSLNLIAGGSARSFTITSNFDAGTNPGRAAVTITLTATGATTQTRIIQYTIA